MRDSISESSLDLENILDLVLNKTTLWTVMWDIFREINLQLKLKRLNV